MAVEIAAFRWVRNSSPFTLLLTSFVIERLSRALWQVLVGPQKNTFPGPGWAFNTWEIGGIRVEVMDVVTIVVTIAVLAMTAVVFKRTLFGIAVRASAEDFDAARLMGVKADATISRAFALSGVLAGIAAVLVMMRAGQAEPDVGTVPLLKGVVAAVIGGLGSLSGAVLGGLVLGLAEVFLRSRLPADAARLTGAFVFALVAILFIVRPGGIISVRRAERV